MNTKLVRPVLVKIDTKDSLISDRNVLTFSDGKIYNPFKNEYYQLILICLDGKIEVGDMVFRWNWFNDIITCDKELLVAEEHGLRLSKVIATQPQLSPDLIYQLVCEYNNEGMQDFEIKITNEPQTDSDMKELLAGKLYLNKPKLTNGFVTVVEKHVFDALNDPKINGVDYENTPVPDYPIGKPLEDYINEKHSQDRCMGFIDGYNARKSEESISYTEEEIKALINKVIYDTNSNPWLITSKLKISDRWFNENKKK